MRDDRRRRVAAALVDHDVDAVGGKHFDRARQRRLGQRMGIDADEQRPGQAGFAAVVADRLRRREDMVFVEGVFQRRAAMARGAEGDALRGIGGIGLRRQNRPSRAAGCSPARLRGPVGLVLVSSRRHLCFEPRSRHGASRRSRDRARHSGPRARAMIHPWSCRCVCIPRQADLSAKAACARRMVAARLSDVTGANLKPVGASPPSDRRYLRGRRRATRSAPRHSAARRAASARTARTARARPAHPMPAWMRWASALVIADHDADPAGIGRGRLLVSDPADRHRRCRAARAACPRPAIVRQAFEQEIEPLLPGQAADDAEQEGVRLRLEAEPLLQRRLVGGARRRAHPR